MVVFSAKAQYYYQDIYNTQQTSKNLLLLKSKNVSKQTVKSLDANMENDNDFYCERLLTKNYNALRSLTKSPSTGMSSMTSSFNSKGLLTRTVDSSAGSISNVKYSYDNAGRLIFVEGSSQARGEKYKVGESRQYVYDSLGLLSFMIHKKSMNPSDSTIVTFKRDEKNNIIEEMETGKNLPGARIYYKYDDQNNLTDVYRYNAARKRMLPDYMMTYDAKQQLVEMTTVNLNTGEYLIWKYQYADDGLPSREMCYGKEKELLGIIKYTYSYFK
ncbi:hypothetical protein LX64_03333 [Chitinophaga skermanii]|uniref:YD repeat-containing protein n=2 Tax=Chitinophaga skermanii TaxID=331697 RepID=A0A327QEX0_9BACT|nr:hypothetical protein LX64_03333 [Chitinophaga skermanii]